MTRRPKSTNGSNERVTNRELNEKLEGMRREMKLWVALGLVGGQTAASLVTSYITRMNPPAQAHALASAVIHLFA